MKKIMSVVMVVIILVSTLWLSLDKAGAAGTIGYRGGLFVWGKGVVFVFDGSGYRNRDVRDAVIFVGSRSYDLHCTVNKEEGKIVCVTGGRLTQYAGQTGVIYLAGEAFYVIIPAKPSLSSSGGTSGPLSCPEGSTLGADVTFYIPLDGEFTDFIPGATLSDVQQSAEGFATEFDASILEIGELYCRQQEQ